MAIKRDMVTKGGIEMPKYNIIDSEQMPIYTKYEFVWMLEIGAISRQEKTRDKPLQATITPKDVTYPSFIVDAQYVNKYWPIEVGDFYAVYPDGYTSLAKPEDITRFELLA